MFYKFIDIIGVQGKPTGRHFFGHGDNPENSKSPEAERRKWQ